MENDAVISKFIEGSDVSYQQILNNMLDGKENLDLKTHIYNPKVLASLKTLAKHLEILEYKESALLVNEFITYFLRYMVSYKRKSREEIIKAIAQPSVKEKEKSLELPTSLA